MRTSNVHRTRPGPFTARTAPRTRPATRSSRAGHPIVIRRCVKNDIQPGPMPSICDRWLPASRANPSRNDGRSRSEYGATARYASSAPPKIASAERSRDGAACSVIHAATRGSSRTTAALYLVPTVSPATTPARKNAREVACSCAASESSSVSVAKDVAGTSASAKCDSRTWRGITASRPAPSSACRVPHRSPTWWSTNTVATPSRAVRPRAQR